jgi:hypothetical protein
MVESDGFDLTYFINSQLKFINQAMKGLFDYVDKKQNEQSNAPHCPPNNLDLPHQHQQ